MKAARIGMLFIFKKNGNYDFGVVNTKKTPFDDPIILAIEKLKSKGYTDIEFQEYRNPANDAVCFI